MSNKNDAKKGEMGKTTELEKDYEKHFVPPGEDGSPEGFKIFTLIDYSIPTHTRSHT